MAIPSCTRRQQAYREQQSETHPERDGSALNSDKIRSQEAQGRDDGVRATVREPIQADLNTTHTAQNLLRTALIPRGVAGAVPTFGRFSIASILHRCELHWGSRGRRSAAKFGMGDSA